MTHYRFDLTPAQERIMDLIVDKGLSNQQIAQELGMAEQTLKNVVAGTDKISLSIFSRMGARSKTQAVIAYLGWRSLKRRGLA